MLKRVVAWQLEKKRRKIFRSKLAPTQNVFGIQVGVSINLFGFAKRGSLGLRLPPFAVGPLYPLVQVS